MIITEDVKNVNFMTPGAWDIMQRRDHISHYGVYSLSSTLIAILLRDDNDAFICHYSVMGLLMPHKQI